MPAGSDNGPCLAVLTTPDEIHPELALFTIRPLDRAQVNKTIQEAGLSGLHNIRIVRTIPRFPSLAPAKRITARWRNC